MKIRQLLHLVGSAQSDFYGELSRLYARDCLVATADPTRYTFHIAYVTPDQQWRFPTSLEATAIAAADPVSLTGAIATLQAKKIDLVMPQMFCLPGMTRYRGLFDLLGIPYLGNTADVMALTAHKAQAKAIVAAAGVNVPRGEVLRPGDTPTLRPPVVIKPVDADNSLGVTLVQAPSDYPVALEQAFAYSAAVLVEDYIPPGREVRCGLIAQAGELIGLPLEEYLIDASERPIRGHADKLKRTDAGELGFSAKGNQKAWIVDPGDPVTQTVQAAAKTCHRALGCRHYSLFDFRIDPQGLPWFLEAGLYCSFSPKSVISEMARTAGIPLPQLLRTVIDEALTEAGIHEEPLAALLA